MLKKFKRVFFVSVLMLTLTSCDSYTYIPKSRKQIRQSTPNVVIFKRIVDFRIDQDHWPVSMDDFIGKNPRYYQAFKDFPYRQTKFKAKDSTTTTLQFWDYAKDTRFYDSDKIDLNAYNGEVRFFKANDKFIWKVKMY